MNYGLCKKCIEKTGNKILYIYTCISKENKSLVPLIIYGRRNKFFHKICVNDINCRFCLRKENAIHEWIETAYYIKKHHYNKKDISLFLSSISCPSECSYYLEHTMTDYNQKTNEGK